MVYSTAHPDLDTSTTESANDGTPMLEGGTATNSLAVPVGYGYPYHHGSAATKTAPLSPSSISSSSSFVSPAAVVSFDSTSGSDSDSSGSAAVSMDSETSSCSPSSPSFAENDANRDADSDHRYRSSTARTSESFRSTTAFDHDHGFLGKRYRTTATSNTAVVAVKHQHPEAQTMKRHRRHTRATYGMAGAVVGTIVLPLVGTIVGGCLAGYSVNLLLKRRERHAKRKWERDSFQSHAGASPAARHAEFA